MKFILNGCDISFIAEAPTELSLIGVLVVFVLVAKMKKWKSELIMTMFTKLMKMHLVG